MFCEEIKERWSRIAPLGAEWYLVSENGIVAGIISASNANPIQIANGVQKPLPNIPRSLAAADDNVILLNAFYAKPSDFQTCAAYAAKPHTIMLAPVRSWMITNLFAPPRGVEAAIVKVEKPKVGSGFGNALTTLIGGVLMKEAQPSGIERTLRTTNAGLTTQGKAYILKLQREREAVVAAVCGLIGATGVADAVAWPLLWLWAAGAPMGGPAPLIPTRAAALMAIGSIANRNPNFVSRSTVDALQKLAASIGQLPPPVSYADEKERQAFAVVAGVAVGDVTSAMIEKNIPVPPELTNPNAYLPPGTTPPGTLPLWVPIVGAVGLAAAITGGVMLRRARRT